jgi:hypothetical protein
MSYKRIVLLQILQDIYPGTPIACGTTYDSIILYYTSEPLVPESVISDKYADYTLAHNLYVLRQERNVRLSQTDMCGLSDFPFPSDEKKQEWLTYRQGLRDITTTNPAPDTDENDKLVGVVWPPKPQ